jgi:hypothetical protein
MKKDEVVKGYRNDSFDCRGLRRTPMSAFLRNHQKGIMKYISSFKNTGGSLGHSLRPAIIIFCVLLIGCATIKENQSVPAPPEKESLSIQQLYGIEIQGIRLIGAGRFLDFRYKVIDPEKASPLMDSRAKAHLIDQETGSNLEVPSFPKVGSMRQKTRQPIAGKIYFILFGNPGVVKPGGKVTVAIGDFKAENLIVGAE